MRIRARYKSVKPSEVGAQLVAQLRAIMPDDRQPELSYHALVDLNDPRAKALEECLLRAGLRPWASEDGAPRRKGIEYSFEFEREYEPSDFVDCVYFQFEPRYIDKLQA